MIKNKMQDQLERNKFRVFKLVMIFDAEIKEMIKELQINNKQPNKNAALNALLNIDKALIRFFIQLYLSRCNFKYVLAFFQWRSLQRHAKLMMLEDLFKQRCLFLADKISQGADQYEKEKIQSLQKKLKNTMFEQKTQKVIKFRNLDNYFDQKGEFIVKVDIFSMHVHINTTDKIETLEELGLTDPDLDKKTGLKKTIDWLRRLDFYNYVYPNDQMDEGRVPRCIFIPEKTLLRKIIKALSKCKNTVQVCELFGLK